MNEERVNTLVHNLIDTRICINNLNDHKKDLEQQIKDELGEGAKHITPEGHQVVVTRPGTRTALESKTIREKYPDIYKACIKTSVTPSQVRLTVADKQ